MSSTRPGDAAPAAAPRRRRSLSTGGDLAGLLHGEVASGVLRAVIRDLTVQVRRNGGTVPTWAQTVCEALAAAAEQHDPPGLSAIGHPPVSVVPRVQDARWLPAAAAADLAGVSDRTVRRLAASGAIRARRVGDRAWLVDPESLRTVLDRRRPA